MLALYGYQNIFSKINKSIKMIYSQFSNRGFVVLTAVVMKSVVFLDMTPCSPLKVNRCFGETIRLHFHDRRIRQARNKGEPVSKHLDFQRTTRRNTPEVTAHLIRLCLNSVLKMHGVLF
jgi:hypothetical protein